MAEETALFDFDEKFDLGKVRGKDIKLTISKDRAGSPLRIATGHDDPWPGVTLKAPAGRWDLSKRTYVALDVTNVGANRVTVYCRADNPGADGRKNCVTASIGLAPGASGKLKVPFVRKSSPGVNIKFFGMRSNPFSTGGDGIDPANVTQLLVFVARPKEDHAFEIDNLRAGGTFAPLPAALLAPDKFFPMIDDFGQYVHRDWPGKTHTANDLVARRREEADDLARRPGPRGWTKYGGHAAGPKLEATGFFHPKKHAGKWWLVDPEGRLYWSHGIDCVNWWSGNTPITDRKHWFRYLPPRGTPLGKFYGRGSWAPHGYYKGKRYEQYNFRAANLLRKYGDGWQKEFTDISHRRLRSWGMNTIANWSSAEIFLERRTPYVVSVNFAGPQLEGSEGYWGKFRDVFDPRFGASLRRSLQKQKGKSAGDPWCIGYFVDNEIAWGDDTSLAIAALVSPPEQPAKKVFVEDLKKKYGTPDKLNAAWGSAYESWDALLNSREAPDKKKARADLLAFYDRTAEEYFRTCREEVKRVAPKNLYLGCRFAWVNDRAARAAARHCDVIGYNLYKRGIADFGLPEGLDKPVIVGEFHFGALDRGMFHTGLQAVDSQAERAAAYKSYVTGALRNPCIVGTHWFQYGDQATTGRGDGENYQIGFVDIADTPYAETIAACREVGYGMYSTRLAKK